MSFLELFSTFVAFTLTFIGYVVASKTLGIASNSHSSIAHYCTKGASYKY